MIAKVPFTVILVVTFRLHTHLSTLLVGCKVSAGQIIGRKYKHSSRHTLKNMYFAVVVNFLH